MNTARHGRAPARAVVTVSALAAAVAAVIVPGSAQAAQPAVGHQPAHQKKDLHGVRSSSVLQSDRQVSVMLQLESAPAAEKYRAALAHGKKAARAASREAVRASASQADAVQARLSSVAPSAKVLFRASRSYSGLAVTVKASQVKALRTIDGVKDVRVLTPKKVDNATSVPLMKAPQAWATGAAGTGQGVTVGVIDTGIDYTHADFGGPGTTAAYDAAKASSSFTPTAKVVGGWDLAGDAYNPDDPAHATPVPDANPLDCEGHGSHVAGTVAGYGVTNAGVAYQGGTPTAADYAAADSTWFQQFGVGGTQAGIGPGVAPLASLYAIKVFGCEGSTNLVVPALEKAMDPNGDGDVSDHLDVVNMSLGGDYASPQDPDAVATNNAVVAGVSVVASMGNAGDLYDVGGAPGNATRSIAVAASDDGFGIFDGLEVTTGGTTTGYPAMESVAYDWATKTGISATDVVSLGDSFTGCDPLTTAQKAQIAGKVVLLHWDEANLACGSAARSDTMAEGGAAGVILGSTLNSFSAGVTGSADIPVMLTTKDASDAILAAIHASTPVQATLSHANHNSESISEPDKVDQIADFSSRGRRTAGGLKPDVSAPGVSTFSVASGTGTTGVAESGTSMASPHVAGEAALVRGAHPSWSPEEVKAAIMNTAGQDVTDLNGEVDGPLRAGAGRVDAERAVGTSSLAYTTTDPGAVSVSFGTIAATKDLTVSKTVRVANKSGADVTYAVGVANASPVPGATYSTSVSSLTVPAGENGEFTVRLAVNREALRSIPESTIDKTFDLGSAIGLPGLRPTPRDFPTIASTLVEVTPAGGDALRVPVAATVRPASTTSETVSGFTAGSTDAAVTATITGTGVDNGSGPNAIQSRGQAFALAASSAKLPTCPADGAACVPFDDARAGDVRALGVTSNGAPVDGSYSNVTQFALNAWGPWATPASFAEFDVLIDADRNGTADFVLYNTRWADTDVMMAELDMIDSDGSLVPWDVMPLNGLHSEGDDLEFGGVDTAKFDSDTLTLPLFTDDLGAPLSRFNYWVESGTIETGLLDTVGSASHPLTFDARHPSIRVTEAGDTTGDSTYADQPGATLNIAKHGSTFVQDGSQGVMFVHFSNVDGARTEAKKTQSIPLPASLKVNHAFASGKFKVGATASSGLPVSITASPSSVCKVVTGGYVQPVAAGICTVTLKQAGNAQYLPAPPTSNRIAFQLAQTITLPASLKVNHQLSAGKFKVGATASSGLPVSISASPSSVCRVSRGYIVPVKAGRCVVTLTQKGNVTYLPAKPVSNAIAFLK